MYKINEVAKFAGVSTRTLRYYDEIGLLKPASFSESNYRYYSQKEVDLLQQILFFKELGYRLTEIKAILQDKDFNLLHSLEKQKLELVKEKQKIDVLLKTINQTIQHHKGDYYMSNQDKFNGLKEKMIQENEEKYGQELRDKYGDKEMEESYQKLRKLSKYEFQKADKLGKDILELLGKIYQSNDIYSLEAKNLASMHQEWIKIYWTSYSRDAHIGLCEMYLSDERFRAYYDKVGVGATEFLVNVVKKHI